MAAETRSVEEVRESLRAEMPVGESWAYFDHAAVSPLPRPTVQAIRTWLREAAREGDPVWPQWSAQVEQARKTAAELVGAATSEIAFILNTTTGIGLVAEGLDWHEGENVVTLADEFPSNVYPWLNLASRGVETRMVKTDPSGRLDLAKLAAACDDRTRLVSASWIGYATGYRHDIERIAEIAHRRGALFFLDAIQGIGAFPLDVGKTPIDFLAADGHKWMLCPEGAGILYIRQENLNRLRPLGVGWSSVVHSHDFNRLELDVKPTAARYEGGTANMSGILALGASLRLLAELGVENIAATILDFTDLACQRLQSVGAKIVSDRALDHRSGEQRSGIVAFELPAIDPVAFRRHCLQRGIALSCRRGRLRIAPHAYNNEEDLERLIDAIATFST